MYTVLYIYMCTYIYIYIHICIALSLSVSRSLCNQKSTYVYIYIFFFYLLPIIPLRGSACKAPCHTCTCANVDAEPPCHQGSFKRKKPKLHTSQTIWNPHDKGNTATKQTNEGKPTQKASIEKTLVLTITYIVTQTG